MSAVRDLDVPDARRRLREFTVIDVRDPEEFTGELGHLEGARLVPLGTIEEAARSWDRKRPYLLVCRSGARAARAGATLSNLGFREVYRMSGGMRAWADRHLPVAR